MNRDKIDTISELLAKYYLDELSEEESVQLKEWMDEEQRHQDLGHRIQQQGFVSDELKKLQKIDEEASYRNFLWKQRSRRMWKYARYAAVILPFGFLLSWGIFQFQDSRSLQQEFISTPISHGIIKAELILDDGTIYNLDEQANQVRLEANNVQISVANGKLSYDRVQGAAVLKYNTLAVPRGGEFILELSDKTVVHLNADSKLRYPIQFGKGKREVFLEGEAFFDVSKQNGSSFLVHTKQGCVTVLGTSFNVRAYGDDALEETTLVTGKVKIKTMDEQEMIIAPGEQCRVNESGELSKRQVDVYPYIAWKEGIFAFDKQPLEEVMKIIGRWYNIDALFETEQLRGILISGKIKRFSDFREVIRLIEMTGNIEFEVKENGVAIKRKQ